MVKKMKVEGSWSKLSCRELILWIWLGCRGKPEKRFQWG